VLEAPGGCCSFSLIPLEGSAQEGQLGCVTAESRGAGSRTCVSVLLTQKWAECCAKPATESVCPSPAARRIFKFLFKPVLLSRLGHKRCCGWGRNVGCQGQVSRSVSSCPSRRGSVGRDGGFPLTLCGTASPAEFKWQKKSCPDVLTA